MIGQASLRWWCLSFFESLDHSIVDSIGQHIGVINQSMINSCINHVLQYTMIGIKGNLPRQRQIMLLDNFPTPVYAEGFQTELSVFHHSPLHSLLLFFSEISFYHANDVVRVEIKSSHVDFVDSVPLDMPKDVLMQK